MPLLRSDTTDLERKWSPSKANGSVITLTAIKTRGDEWWTSNAGMRLKSKLPKASLDAVFTDPPYFGNVQYAELMDFCYVWLRRLVGEKIEAFERESTRNPQELTGNEDMGRGLEHFTQGLSDVYQRMAAALKPGSPLAFTYHHNDLSAYSPVAVAILDAGLACTASLPCPAEMGASIHINGTGSSIIDTVFVCRSTGTVSRKWLPDSIEGVADLVAKDLARLREGGVKPTPGDARCVTYGHLIRLAVWHLQNKWDKNKPVSKKLEIVAGWLRAFKRQEENDLVDTGEGSRSENAWSVGEDLTWGEETFGMEPSLRIEEGLFD